MTVFDEQPRSSLARDGSVLPEGWDEISLAEVIVHKIGGEWGEEAPGEGLVAVRVVRGTEFRAWERDKGKTAAQRWIQSTHLTPRVLQPGDLVIEISGGGPGQPVGRTLLIDEKALLLEPLPPPPLICNNFCRLLRVHRALEPAFVHLALREKYLRGDVLEFQNQTTNLRNLQLDEYLDGTFLRVPPRAEQRRIVAAVEGLLTSAAEAREQLLEAHRMLRRFRQVFLATAGEGRLTEGWRLERSAAAPAAGLLAGVFAERRKSFESAQRQAALAGSKRPRAPFNLDPGALEVPNSLSLPDLPEGWVFAPLQDLVETLQYGTSQRANKKLKEGVQGVPVLRMGNIRDGKIDPSDLKLIDPATEDVPKFTLRRGDILFNRTNSPELVGKAAVFGLADTMIFASYLVRITCDERLVLPEYLCGWINSPWGRSWARAVRTDCISQSNINAAKLRTLPVPLPPLDEQREIVRRMQKAFKDADEVEKLIGGALNMAERLPQAILEQAMRGDLVPLEAELARRDGAEYEPARVFLDLLRAEREETAPERQKRSSRRRKRGLSTEALLAIIRRISWGSAERTAEELADAMALRLKVPEPGPELQARLHRHVEIAVERRILARKGDRLVAATPKIGRYDGEFLLGTLGEVMREGVSYDRKRLSRAVVSWLGYDQLTAAMFDRVDEVIREAVRRGLLAVEGNRYRFIHSKSS